MSSKQLSAHDRWVDLASRWEVAVADGALHHFADEVGASQVNRAKPTWLVCLDPNGDRFGMFTDVAIHLEDFNGCVLDRRVR